MREARTSRRHFSLGAALGIGALTAGAGSFRRVFAGPRSESSMPTPVLRGTAFDLVVGEIAVNYSGKLRTATAINGSVPAPTLVWREGDSVTIRVTNRLREPTSIHWHGLILPYQMDGVPGISFAGIGPGETFVYQFPVLQSGTYWYHSHSGMQEQTGMYGAIVIEPRSGGGRQYERDYVVQLADWTDDDPMLVMSRLKARSDYYNFAQPTARDFLRDASRSGLGTALDRRRMWSSMRMSPTDLADVSAAGYTYLLNGRSSDGNWTGLFRPGEKVRLRLINSGAMTFFDVRIPGLPMTVIQADGQDVEPVTVDELRIGVAETYDVVVSPRDEAYTIFAQSMDRSGFVRGTLAVRPGLSAPVPDVDPLEWLTMQDMMGSAHGGHSGSKGAESAMGAMDHGAMDHAVMGHASGAPNGRPTGPRVRHAKTEYGPAVDMRVDVPSTALDDPGPGLRGNGRRVLTYADLHTIGGALDPREPEREIELHLTGNMWRYMWSLDGVSYGESLPVHFRYGERLRVVHVNDTMMAHPMHLHGMWQELENAGGEFQVRKHVIVVQPAQRLSFRVTADALGRWAWHCHLLIHMDMGMFREVVVA